jgi:hypothetical protein
MSKEAIEHYEAALKEAFPSGATGDVFYHWNEARKALAEQPAQQQEPVVRWDSDGWGDLLVDGLPDGTLLYTSPSNQPGYQAMAMAVTRLQKRCSELEGKQPAQQQEPVAWAEFDFRAQEFTGRTAATLAGVESVGLQCEWVPQMRPPAPAQQQEPVGRLESDPYEGHVFVPRIDGDWSMLGKDLYNAPPAQRKPLDAGEISRIWKQHTSEDGPHHNPYDDDGLGFARAIEAAHNIKENT